MKIDIDIGEIINTAMTYEIFLRKGKVIDEENVKQTIVLPLLACLGYNIFSLNEVEAEYPADLRYTKKTKNSEKVDYAIKSQSKPIVFIECKKFGEDLSPHIGQLQRYYATDVNVQRAILTNGNDFWLFSDYDNRNMMDNSPYIKIRLTDEKRDKLFYFNDFLKEKIGDL